MTTKLVLTPPDARTDPNDLRTLLTLWCYDLREMHSAGTVVMYRASVTNLINFLTAEGMPLIAGEVSSKHIKRFLGRLRESGYMPSTVLRHYIALDQLFKYAIAEDAITRSPLDGVAVPQIPDRPVPIIGRSDLKRLLSTCSGRVFEDRRDAALITFLLDTGCRVSEVVGLTLSDVDLLTKRIAVTGKGNRVRHIAPGNKNLRCLAQYLRVRSSHPSAGTDAFWLSKKGVLSVRGLQGMLNRRCRQAGIQPINPHRFRHTWAHNWMAANLGETNLMYLAGWRTRGMLNRYGVSAVGDRARQAQIAHSPADQILP